MLGLLRVCQKHKPDPGFGDAGANSPRGSQARGERWVTKKELLGRPEGNALASVRPSVRAGARIGKSTGDTAPCSTLSS